jgi:Ca2+-binding RTX toxin-like protein
MSAQIVSEALEGRTLLSAATFLSGHTLHVRGVMHSANTIEVQNSADQSAVEVSVAFLNRRGVAKNFTASFPKTLGIERLRITGGMEADTITIDQSASALDIDAAIHARAGNDTVTAGDGDDRIFGGRGDDVITAAGGDDLVRARWGNDTVTGGEGNDTLWGGAGDDSLEGNAGNDKLGGIAGVNALLGAEGNDIFVVRSLEANTHDFNEAEDAVVIKTKPDKDD